MNEENKIIKEFESSAKRGTGKTYLLIRKNPNIDFTKSIIKIAVRNYAYDGQSEGSRGIYAFNLIQSSKYKEIIKKEVIHRLHLEKEDTWTLTQLFEIAKLFVIAGDKEAKASILDRFFENWIFGSNWAGQDEILELDGLNGLYFIANKIGRYIEQNPDYFENYDLIDHFQDTNKNIAALNSLEEAAKTDHYIQIYLDQVRTCSSQVSNHRIQEHELNFENLLNRINRSEKVYNIRKYLKNLSETEIHQLAYLFQKEKNIRKKTEYLRIFICTKYPLAVKHLLKFAKRKESAKFQLREIAIQALEQIESPLVRKLSIKKMTSSKNFLGYVDLLISNYKIGDAKLLTHLAKKTKNLEKVERLATAFTNIYSTHPTKECLEPLLAIYHKSNCGIHRKSILEILINNNQLPESILNEMEFDSYKGTRELFKKVKEGIP